jgi:hypothetical protein
MTRTPTNLIARALAAGAGFALASGAALAGPRDQAYRIFNRLNGTPPSPATLDALEKLVADGDLKGAAMAAIDDASGNFYNVVLKGMAARWSNADRTPRITLNDYVATVIGMARDDVPFDTVLSADLVYVANTAGAPAYSLVNNDHYKFLQDNGVDLKQALQPQAQSSVGGLPESAVAGVLSTRGFAEAYYQAGTNRRAIAFTLSTYLCKELEQLMDTTRPDFRVRRDVTRAPGGDSAMFRNRCAGCHAGMDAFGGAFAYYDFTPEAGLAYTAGAVQPKFNRNVTEFPDGFVTTDDSWINNWTVGQNKVIGWHGATDGNGAKSFGETITDTDAFASCMAQHAFQTVCLRKPTADADAESVKALAAGFAADGFKFKGLFAETATICAE